MDHQNIDIQVAENDAKLSGGQRLRFTRAMFTAPMLLVLKKATSSLDGPAETDTPESTSNFRGTVTGIVISHRLTTIRSSNEVMSIYGGKILYQGTFAEIRKTVPDFER